MEFYCKNDKPYIYVSFPKEQTSVVLPVLENVGAEGVAFWYKESWDKKEQRRVQGAFGVLLFVNAAFAQTDYFRTLVDTAVACNQKILCVYLEEIPSTPWSAMQLGSQQALFTKTLDDSFIAALKEAFIFRNMKVTSAQKKFQRKRAITMVSAPILASIVLFFTIINPLLIAPAMATNQLAKQWGLTKEDLESITELHIVGNQVFNCKVHAWYNGNNHNMVSYNQEIDGWDQEQAPIEVGTLTSEDLSILQYMPNLEWLEIEGQQITDITPVFDTNVSVLRLNCNPITSIAGIEKMENLTELILTDTQITDLRPAFSLPNLQLIQVDGTYVRNVDGVENLMQLKSLYVNNTYVQSIPTLGEIENLTIDLRQIQLENLAFLSNVKSIRHISIDNLTADEVVPYLEGKQIQELNICGISDITDLYPLTIVSGGHLGIANNYLTTLDGIEHFQGIEHLDIHHNANGSYNYLTDISAIMKISSLKAISISSDMMEMAQEQLQGAHFQIDICDN